MYDYVTPQKTLDALKFLQANNPLYAHFSVNEQWVEQAMANDEELCMSLIEQAESMEIEQSSINAVNVSMEYNYDMLRELAFQNGFVIHDVPYDGNCMFSAIFYQLQNSGVCNVDSNNLREMVASYLNANAESFCNFISEPVASHDTYNADTKLPTDEDMYISAITDPQLQTKLRWEKYLRRLRQGAWGDHIAMQGIADMLSVKIHVLSIQQPMLTVISKNCSTSNCEVFLGLIMQYHYVGLDKIPIGQSSPSQIPPNS